jgi:hypothetical protein
MPLEELAMFAAGWILGGVAMYVFVESRYWLIPKEKRRPHVGPRVG